METIKCPSAMDKNEVIVNTTIQKNEVTIMYLDGGKVNNILISRKKKQVSYKICLVYYKESTNLVCL